MTTVVVAGALAAKPYNAGNAWTRLSWAASFAALGFDVWLVEHLAPGAGDDEALAWAQGIFESRGLAARAAVLGPDDEVVLGPATCETVEAVSTAALVLDIGGHLGTAGPPRRGGGVRVFLDDDPGFTQVWDATGSPGSRLCDHDLHLTYGANVGRPGCPLPTAGRRWHAVRPPVLLDEWAMPPGPPLPRRFTTVATWRSPFGSLRHDGVVYGLKHHEFRKVSPLPGMVDAEFTVALDIHQGDIEDLQRLCGAGWEIVDPRRVAGDPVSYRNFVQASGAEFSPAQGVYVQARTGWISDRTASYLAAGRPALVQDTGVASSLPVGEGLLTYRNLDDAATTAARLADDLDGEGRAARALAEEFFDGPTIAAQVCELAGVAP